MEDGVVIVSATRTPIGAFNGAFANLPAHELGKVAIVESLKRAGVEGKDVSEVIMGQILTAGQGQNPARQASIAAGISVESPASGVNQVCVSGLRAVAVCALARPVRCPVALPPRRAVGHPVASRLPRRGDGNALDAGVLAYALLAVSVSVAGANRLAR
jgi:hypothetical protein